MFDIFLDIPAQKFLKKLDIASGQRIIEAIKKLAEDPILHNSKRIIGEKRKFLGLELASFVCFIELIMKIIV